MRGRIYETFSYGAFPLGKLARPVVPPRESRSNTRRSRDDFLLLSDYPSVQEMLRGCLVSCVLAASSVAVQPYTDLRLNLGARTARMHDNSLCVLRAHRRPTRLRSTPLYILHAFFSFVEN